MVADDNAIDTGASIDCVADPIGSLKSMFVDMVQAGRIRQGQCPAQRPVFLKPHGVAHGKLVIRADLPDALKIGIFAGKEYPAWVRFSSDTVPTSPDYKTTVGVGMKLFGVAGAKLVGQAGDVTADFIFQNHDRFFVDTAADMCAFTRAGVVDGDYGPYLAQHPVTASILNEMAKPVASVLAETYWSILPFTFGHSDQVKYRLEPLLPIAAIADAPADPTYLAADLRQRLSAGAAQFRFSIQRRTDPASMPLDAATVRWDEGLAPWIAVADLVLVQQDITARGQAEYGENLAMNIWRVPANHAPVGSLAEARKVVYAASADQRRNVNGVPAGEPDHPRPPAPPPAGRDTRIVSARIHPGIGIARIGDSPNEFFIGPEVTDPAPSAPGFYRDSSGALKRQAARFRLYGYNAAGEVVRELTTDNATINWTVHLANTKSSWYRFIGALDIPEAAMALARRRNAAVRGPQRRTLEIDPGPRSIGGANVKDGPNHVFDTGRFKQTSVTLGELRTDDKGRLLVLGGTGRSESPSGSPVFDPTDPETFNNADDWFDDISDGSVTAAVSIAGHAIPVTNAWVAVAPPNYAPDVIGWRTLYDQLIDIYVEAGWMPLPSPVSFTRHVLPVLRRLSRMQWVNKGFAALFGHGRPMDFDDPDFVAKLAQPRDPVSGNDPYGELRVRLLGAFRPADTTFNEPRLWPWIYGDAFDDFPNSPRRNIALSKVRAALLERWAAGDFVDDWSPAPAVPVELDRLALSQRPAMLDEAALHFCLADAFHPGCELTWPMRHLSLYEAPFRIRHRRVGTPEPDYGASMTQSIAQEPDGPLHAQAPGGLTRWMALPWQGDTAFCRSGYDPSYDPYLPSFWAARVPNQVLTEASYAIVMNDTLSRAERLAAFDTRSQWLRALRGSAPQQMMQMVAQFGAMGLVEARPGIANDPDFPPIMLVESLAAQPHPLMAAAVLPAAQPKPTDKVALAGWESREQLEEFRRIRTRRP